MKIGFYSNHGSEWIAGVLYIQTVIRALAELPETVRPRMHLLMHRATDIAHYGDLQHALASTIRYDHIAASSWRRWMKNCLRRLSGKESLQRCIRQAGVDVVFPCMKPMGKSFPVPWIGWIPDFQHRRLPELFSADERGSRDRHYQGILDEAAHVVVSSEDARADLLRFYRVCPERISVYRFRTHADPRWFEGDPHETVRELGLPRKFLMFPSQWWKHKNHLVLIEAMARVRDAGIDDVFLVLTGKDSDFRHPDHAQEIRRAIAGHGLEERIRDLGLLPRWQQVQLMRAACAIVQPSCFEGWSMLVEDCRALGKTVFLSDIPVHREQAYPRVEVFAPESADQLASRIAARWSSLLPGPDFGAESGACRENARLIRENGEILLRMFEAVLAAHTP